MSEVPLYIPSHSRFTRLGPAHRTFPRYAEAKYVTFGRGVLLVSQVRIGLLCRGTSLIRDWEFENGWVFLGK
jgi:hypothetical protein